jgi:triacylglycerol lipase
MRTAPAALAALALSIVVLVAPTATPATQALAHDPILFVHGWNSNSSTWTTMIGRFQADGWAANELWNWSYNTSQSNVTTAQEINTKVNDILAATGASKVDIISHSMGGLSSRYYSKNLGGSAKIDEWVSLGGPNHGTDTAYFCTQTACISHSDLHQDATVYAQVRDFVA